VSTMTGLRAVLLGLLWLSCGAVFVWAMWPRGRGACELISAAEADADAARAAAAAGGDVESLGALYAAYLDDVDRVVDSISDVETDAALRRLLKDADDWGWTR
jgi:hypothetical protein